MPGTMRLLAGSGSFAANALLLLTLELAQPGQRWLPGLAGGAPRATALATPWRPFIDNPGDDPTRADRQPHCPGPAAPRGGIRLDLAPLPSGFDPHGHAGSAIFACVRVEPSGRVTAVRLMGGPGGRIRARIVTAIRHEWLFAVESFGPSEPSWQRVRLTSGAVDEPVHGGAMPLF